MHTSTQRLRPQPSRCSVQRMSPHAQGGVRQGLARIRSQQASTLRGKRQRCAASVNAARQASTLRGNAIAVAGPMSERGSILDACTSSSKFADEVRPVLYRNSFGRHNASECTCCCLACQVLVCDTTPGMNIVTCCVTCFQIRCQDCD